MILEGSCHCRAVAFSVESKTPRPYMCCYCSICRKTAGGGGFAVNLGGEAETLTVRGRRHLKIYRARLEDGSESPAERRFCGRCGSALWVWDPRWPELLHPFASAIDTPLPAPPERCHIMVDFAPGWVRVPAGKRDPHFPGYPDQSIKDWHRSRDLLALDTGLPGPRREGDPL